SPNQSACLDQGDCAAGTELTQPGTATSPTECTACPAGSYCAGGAAPEVACGGTTWDDDGSSATACVAKSNCGAGQYVANNGSATTDRSCAACGAGTFSTVTNAVACSDWTDCQPGTYVSQAGTSSSNRQCAACPEGTTTHAENATMCSAEEPETSCAARSPNSCCLGTDNSCTAPGGSCYCDEYCVQAGDCCADYIATCGG